MYGIRRSFCFLLIGIWILLTSCGPTTQNNPIAQNTITDESTRAPAAPKPPLQNRELHGTISIYHSWEEDKRPALDKILRDFSKLYPDIYFDITYVPANELRDLFANEVSHGRGPTLLFGPVEWASTFFDDGLVKEVENLVDDQVLENLNLPARQASTFKGHLISLPYSIHGIVLYRNKDIMTIKADTFNELVMLAQAATQGEISGAMLEQSFLYSGGHLLGLGGKIMDDEGLPAFDSPEGEAWLKLLSNFQLAGKTTFYSDEDIQNFEAGKVGWIIDGTWNMVELGEAIGTDKLAVDQWPEDETGKLSGFVQSDNVYLSSSAGDPIFPAVKAFLDYFLSQQAQIHLVEVNLIPAAQSLDMPKARYSAIIAEAMTAMSGGVAYPALPVMDLYAQQLDLAIQAYLGGKSSASEALTRASEAITEELNSPTPSPTP